MSKSKKKYSYIVQAKDIEGVLTKVEYRARCPKGAAQKAKDDGYTPLKRNGHFLVSLAETEKKVINEAMA